MNCCQAQHDAARQLRERATLVHDASVVNAMLEAADIIDNLCVLLENQHAELQRLALQPA